MTRSHDARSIFDLRRIVSHGGLKLCVDGDETGAGLALKNIREQTKDGGFSLAGERSISASSARTVSASDSNPRAARPIALSPRVTGADSVQASRSDFICHNRFGFRFWILDYRLVVWIWNQGFQAPARQSKIRNLKSKMSHLSRSRI